METNLTSIVPKTTDNNDSLSSIQIIASVIFLFFGIISIAGNIIFCVAMYQAKLLRSGGYLILVHYAITDIMTGCLEVFYMPLSVLLQQTLGPAFIYGFVLTFDEMASKLFIIFMAFTRFYSIMFPLRARSLMHISWYKTCMWIIWTSSIVLSIPLWVGKSQCFEPCSYHWKFNVNSQKWVLIYGAIFNLGASIVIIVVYPICFYKMIKTSILWNGTGPSASRRQSVSLQNSHREMKVLILFFVNGIIFILYWLPVYLVNLWHIQIPNIALFEEIMRCIEVSYNPFLYVSINPHIRCAVKKLLCRRWCVDNSSVTNSRQKLVSASDSTMEQMRYSESTMEETRY